MRSPYTGFISRVSIECHMHWGYNFFILLAICHAPQYSKLKHCAARAVRMYYHRIRIETFFICWWVLWLPRATLSHNCRCSVPLIRFLSFSPSVCACVRKAFALSLRRNAVALRMFWLHLMLNEMPRSVWIEHSIKNVRRRVYRVLNSPLLRTVFGVDLSWRDSLFVNERTIFSSFGCWFCVEFVLMCNYKLDSCIVNGMHTWILFKIETKHQTLRITTRKEKNWRIRKTRKEYSR